MAIRYFPGRDRDKSAAATKEMWSGYYGSLLSQGSESDEAIEAVMKRYAFRHTWYNSLRVVMERGQPRAGERVLDAGCGWGRILMGLLKSTSGVNFTAMDLTEESIAQGRKLFGNSSEGNSIEWKQGNIEALPFEDEQFDLVYSARVFQHLTDPVQGAKEVRRVLKKGGRFVIFHQNRWCPLNLRYYSRVYSPRAVRAWYAAAGFEKFKVRSMDFVPGIESIPLDRRLSLERALENVPGLDFFGGKVLAWGEK